MDEDLQNKSEPEFKIITLGNSGVGKTSIIQRFMSNDFNYNQLSTLGVAFSYKTIEINNQKIKFKLIDTGGQEKYRALSKSYFKHADVVLFVFDLNNKNSFESIQYWVDLFSENSGEKSIIGKYLIGNKNDLEQNVDQDLIDELVEKNNLLYMSTSAQTKHQIEELFQFIGGELYEYLKKKEKNKGNSSRSKGKALSKVHLNQRQERKCCK